MDVENKRFLLLQYDIPLIVQNREEFASVSRRSSEVQNNAGRSMKDINVTETVIIFYFNNEDLYMCIGCVFGR